MKKIYILLLLFLATGLNCYAQVDRTATKQERIDAAKAFIEKGAELNQYSVKDFLQASGYVFYPEEYSKDLQKRADKGDLKAMRDVIYHKTLTCNFHNSEETQKVLDLTYKFATFLQKNSTMMETEENRTILISLVVIEYRFIEEVMEYEDMVNHWATQFKLAPGNVPHSNCYARSLINSYFKSNSHVDNYNVGNRLLLRNVKENDDIISAILMIKMFKYQAHKNNSGSWDSVINGYKKILSELTDGQITDVPFDESSLSNKTIF